LEIARRQIFEWKNACLFNDEFFAGKFFQTFPNISKLIFWPNEAISGGYSEKSLAMAFFATGACFWRIEQVVWRASKARLLCGDGLSFQKKSP